MEEVARGLQFFPHKARSDCKESARDATDKESSVVYDTETSNPTKQTQAKVALALNAGNAVQSSLVANLSC